MKENKEKKENKNTEHDPKLHFSERHHIHKSTTAKEENVNLNDSDTRENLTRIAANEQGRRPIYSTDRGNSRPDDRNTGRWQTTTIKGQDPSQTQSPDVGADNSVEEEYKKDPFHAQYGLNHANKGSRMSTDSGSGRGEKGLKGTPSGKRSQAMNQSLNMGQHQGNKGGKTNNT